MYLNSYQQQALKISNFYLKVKTNYIYFSDFFASLRYYANKEASVAPACGSRQQVTFVMTENLREIRK